MYNGLAVVSEAERLHYGLLIIAVDIFSFCLITCSRPYCFV